MRPLRAALFVLALPAAVLLAAEPWYESYESALKAVAARQWSVAETKLKAAMKDGPKPGRRVRTYGMRYVDYLPDYYLGLVYFNQQRQKEALEPLRKAAASGLLSESDPEYRSLTEMIEKAEASLAPKPEPAKPAADAPRPAADAAPKPAPSEPPRLAAEAPRTPSESAKAPDAPRAEATAIPAPPPRPRGPEAPAPAAKRSAEPVPAAAATAEAQQAALRAFFAGNYQEAAQKLDAVAAGPGRSAPALFYLGASHAALGLLREDGRGERPERARRAFGEARTLDPRFEADPRLVSPRILKLWRESQR